MAFHQKIFIGTASDRYAVWIGQIYSPGRYDSRITHRTHKVGKQSFVENVLPVIKMALTLDNFFKAITPDTRYHIKLRTESYLTNPVFEVLEKHGV